MVHLSPRRVSRDVLPFPSPRSMSQDRPPFPEVGAQCKHPGSSHHAWVMHAIPPIYNCLTPLGHCLSTKVLFIPLFLVKASLTVPKTFVCSWILKTVTTEILFKVYKHVWSYTLLFDLPYNAELLKGRSCYFVLRSFFLYVSHWARERRAGSTLH